MILNTSIFCYSLRDANTGAKLVGGTIHADTMEEAAVGAARRLQLVLEVETHRYVLWRKDRRVYLYVTAIPEYVLLGKIPQFTNKVPEPEPDYSIEEWKREVSEGDTKLGYAEWAEHKQESDQSDE
jgi:hypothetical protein